MREQLPRAHRETRRLTRLPDGEGMGGMAAKPPVHQHGSDSALPYSPVAAKAVSPHKSKSHVSLTVHHSSHPFWAIPTKISGF
ncbi:MAG TPA: hypothetical protein ENJ82_07370 [Bacteroidetes bacterium]|nr:hypothetical protein [Bacteroidota bacterium]